MENRYGHAPAEVAGMSTEELRRHFLVAGLFQPGAVNLVYTHQDRVILGGAMPTGQASLALEAPPELRAEHFLDRRELAILCIAGAGVVTVDGATYAMPREACLYVGRGAREVGFAATEEPAKFYLFSAPAHASHPTTLIPPGQGQVRHLGATTSANVRTINRIIIPEAMQTCQVQMGLTRLEPGSVWNSMPAHTHERRMECYLYLDLGADDRVVHLMGTPEETRHLIVANEQAVISPDWSLHCGVATSNYAFVWAMAGENQDYDDMDPVPIAAMR